MTNKEQIRCIALVAREHGLATLKEIQQKDNLLLIAIFTHKFNPKSYDSKQNIRDDFEEYELFSKQNNIPLFSVNSKDENIILDEYVETNDFHFLISISWRYLISERIFEKARYGAINLHRGDLPKYAGVEPIKKALQNNEQKIAICCHHISKNFDEGEVIFKSYHDTNYEEQYTLENNVDRLKKEITPYFPKLTIKTLQFLMENHRNE
tara:strand:+ start:20602 stop:21228 length:627 start_codon:yes stop_codon:yes gene_type:complete